MKLVRRIVPQTIALPLFLCLAFNMFCYYGGMLLSGLFPVHNWTLPIDDRIPVRPWWVTVYVLSFLFWAVNYILASRDRTGLVYRLAAADLFSKAVSLLIFIFLPMTMTQPQVQTRDFGSWLLNLIYKLDEPTNLFPSLHCTMAWLSLRPLFGCKSVPKWYKAFSTVFFVLILFSTLFTKQHVFVDVIAGWVLGVIAYELAPHLPLVRWLERLNEAYLGFLERRHA